MEPDASQPLTDSTVKLADADRSFLAQPEPAGETPTTITLGGLALIPHHSGALFVPEFSALVIADLHLEKGTSRAGSGVFLPPYDSRTSLQQLESLLQHFSPRLFIALGDSFHDTDAPARLRADDAAYLAQLALRQQTIWITGNHDPELPQGLPGSFADHTSLGPLSLRHEPDAAAHLEIAGHLHPSARMRQRGRVIRRKCFLSSEARVILPAFGAYTGGLDISAAAFAPLFADADFTAWMLGRACVFPITAKRLKTVPGN